MDWINGNDQFWRFCWTRRSDRGNRFCNWFIFRFLARSGCREKNNAPWLWSGSGTFSCLRRTTRWRFLRARSHPSRLHCANIHANRDCIRDGRCDGSNNFEISRSNFWYRAHSYRSKSDALGADSTICIAWLDRWTLCRRFRSWHEICTSCIQPSSYSVARQASSWRCAACRMRRDVDIASPTTITDDDHRNKCSRITAILWQWISIDRESAARTNRNGNECVSALWLTCSAHDSESDRHSIHVGFWWCGWTLCAWACHWCDSWRGIQRIDGSGACAAGCLPHSWSSGGNGRICCCWRPRTACRCFSCL